MAFLYSSSEGSLWCQTTSFSIKLTPLPLIVLAIIKLGFFSSKGTLLNIASNSLTELPFTCLTDNPNERNLNKFKRVTKSCWIRAFNLLF